MNTEEPNFYKQRNLELRIMIGFVGGLLLLLGGYFQKTYDENTSLKSSLQQLEKGFAQQQKKNQQRYDSLQQHIELQEAVHQQLRDSLARFEDRRYLLNKRSNENKAALTRIRDVDSLRNAVARHYRQ